MDFDLWTYPLPQQVGYSGSVFSDTGVFLPLAEVKKGGRLVSKVPRAIRHCVTQVYKKRGIMGREGLSSAFAICTAQMQKAGQIKSGTQKATKKGSKKHKASKAKDVDYESILKAVKK